MYEPAAKTSIKKVFKAPVLNVLGGDSTKSINKIDSLEAKESKSLKCKQQEIKGDGKEIGSNTETPAPKKANKLKKEVNEAKPTREDRTSKKEKKLIKKLKIYADEISPTNENRNKKPEVLLTDSQYEEIFKAVLWNPSQPKLKIDVDETSRPNENKKNKKIEETKGETRGTERSPDKEKNKEKLKKPEVSLTESHYEEIFKAVLWNPSQPNTLTEDLPEAVANLSEKSSVKGCQMEPIIESSGSVKERNLSMAGLSPWGSHISKQNSQASSILKELQQSQASSLTLPLSPDPTSSSDETDGGADAVLSQRSVQTLSQRTSTQPQPRIRKVDKRHVLEDLQAKRNVGLWVYCDRMTCQKQRYLPDVTDPQDLPDVWYCHMNPDPRYNSCSCEEQLLSVEEEEDMIDNQFTCGSVVWAQVTGFPWWPAMVDDDPDLECYYWLLEEDMRTVTFYHVVFFDKKEVTRAWIPIKKIVPFKKNMHTFKARVMRGIDFTTRLQVAKEEALEAVAMTTVQRLKKFSFIARYKGPIFHDQKQVEKTKKKYKLKCSIGETEGRKRGRKRRVNTSDETPAPCEKTLKTIEDKKYQKHRKLSETDNKKAKMLDSVEYDSDTNLEVTEIARKLLDKEFDTGSVVCSLENTPVKPGKDEAVKQKYVNLEVSMATSEKISKDDECDASETPSGILVDTKLNSAKETAQNPGEGGNKSKPPSVTGSNVSKKSKAQGEKPVMLQEESFGSEIEPSQMQRVRAEDEASQNKLSQSTIADFLAAESEDAVVPEASCSQLSEPFEE